MERESIEPPDKWNAARSLTTSARSATAGRSLTSDASATLSRSLGGTRAREPMNSGIARSKLPDAVKSTTAAVEALVQALTSLLVSTSRSISGTLELPSDERCASDVCAL